MKKYRVAILGYYGFGNLGDELLLEACLAMLGRCGVNREEVVVLTNAPEECNGPAVNRWKLSEAAAALRESETLLLGGGGLFQDSTSVKSCVWYWSMVRLARMFSCKVWAIGQSIGPLRSVVGKILASNALRGCEVVHVRDDGSYESALRLGCERVVIGSDVAMTLSAPACASDGTCPCRLTHSIVNLRPSPLLDRFVHTVAPHIDAHTIGAALSDEDIPPLQKLGLSRVVRVRNLHDAISLWSGASWTVGMRLHFGVLSRIFRKPLALLPYDPKISGFAQQSGVPCIVDQWVDPVMPLPVPANSADEIDALCREILAL